MLQLEVTPFTRSQKKYPKTYRGQEIRNKGGDSMSIEDMKNVDVRTVDPETLVDITEIKIDESMPKEERIKEYLRQVKNPYCFRVGDMVVKCSYSNDGVTIRDRFEQLVRTL